MKKKDVVFHGNSEKQLHKFPQTKLEKIVYSLVQLQHGMKASLKTKPLHGLGDGVMEFVQNGKPAYRCANSTSKCNSRLKIRLLSEVRQKPPVAV